jgi:DNA-binding IclR family transcriptional regulator
MRGDPPPHIKDDVTMTDLLPDAHVAAAGKRTAAARVLDLLEAFGRGRNSLTLTEISRRANLSLTTAHRLVNEVLDWGGLEMDEDGRYRLSMKILSLASQSTKEMQLREHALPHMVQLQAHIGHTTHLVVRDGCSAMFIDSIRAYPDYTGESRIGGHLPLHSTATGLVLLAYLGEEAIDDYLRGPLKRYTSTTLVDPDILRRYLSTVRASKYAVAEGALVPEWAAVAAPIFAPGGSVEGSVGVVCPLASEDPRTFVAPVRTAAVRITRALGERDPAPSPQMADFKRRHVSPS